MKKHICKDTAHAVKLVKESIKKVETIIEYNNRIDKRFKDDEGYCGYEKNKRLLDALEVVKIELELERDVWQATAEQDANYEKMFAAIEKDRSGKKDEDRYLKPGESMTLNVKKLR